jgi:Cdc6-like AAA superfamily ATPase
MVCLSSVHHGHRVLNFGSVDLLAVEGIVEPNINVHAIDRLVMRQESNKATIKAICQAYTTGDVHEKPFFADFIQGKGEGQIILLHGPPGTGKTLTAGMIYVTASRSLRI